MKSFDTEESLGKLTKFNWIPNHLIQTAFYVRFVYYCCHYMFIVFASSCCNIV